MFTVRDSEALDQCRINEDGEEWGVWGCVLGMEPGGFAEGLIYAGW